MTISEALEGFAGETMLKIGAAASYFYIGTVWDYLAREKEIDAEVRRYYKNKRKAREEERKTLLERDMGINTYAAGCKEPNLEGYLTRITGWFGQVRIANRRLEKAKLDISRYVSIYNREVVRCEKADPVIEPDCIIIVVEGNEVGKFWTTDEGLLGEVGLVGEEPDSED